MVEHLLSCIPDSIKSDQQVEKCIRDVNENFFVEGNDPISLSLDMLADYGDDNFYYEINRLLTMHGDAYKIITDSINKKVNSNYNMVIDSINILGDLNREINLSIEEVQRSRRNLSYGLREIYEIPSNFHKLVIKKNVITDVLESYKIVSETHSLIEKGLFSEALQNVLKTDNADLFQKFVDKLKEIIGKQCEKFDEKIFKDIIDCINEVDKIASKQISINVTESIKQEFKRYFVQKFTSSENYRFIEKFTCLVQTVETITRNYEKMSVWHKATNDTRIDPENIGLSLVDEFTSAVKDLIKNEQINRLITFDFSRMIVNYNKFKSYCAILGKYHTSSDIDMVDDYIKNFVSRSHNEIDNIKNGDNYKDDSIDKRTVTANLESLLIIENNDQIVEKKLKKISLDNINPINMKIINIVSDFVTLTLNCREVYDPNKLIDEMINFIYYYVLYTYNGYTKSRLRIISTNKEGSMTVNHDLKDLVPDMCFGKLTSMCKRVKAFKKYSVIEIKNDPYPQIERQQNAFMALRDYLEAVRQDFENLKSSRFSADFGGKIKEFYSNINQVFECFSIYIYRCTISNFCDFHDVEKLLKKVDDQTEESLPKLCDEITRRINDALVNFSKKEGITDDHRKYLYSSISFYMVYILTLKKKSFVNIECYQKVVKEIYNIPLLRGTNEDFNGRVYVQGKLAYSNG